MLKPPVPTNPPDLSVVGLTRYVMKTPTDYCIYYRAENGDKFSVAYSMLWNIWKVTEHEKVHPQASVDLTGAMCGDCSVFPTVDAIILGLQKLNYPVVSYLRKKKIDKILC